MNYHRQGDPADAEGEQLHWTKLLAAEVVISLSSKYNPAVDAARSCFGTPLNPDSKRYSVLPDERNCRSIPQERKLPPNGEPLVHAHLHRLNLETT